MSRGWSNHAGDVGSVVVVDFDYRSFCPLDGQIAPEMSRVSQGSPSGASDDSGRNSLGVPKAAFPARGSQQVNRTKRPNWTDRRTD